MLHGMGGSPVIATPKAFIDKTLSEVARGGGESAGEVDGLRNTKPGGQRVPSEDRTQAGKRCDCG